MCIGKLNPRDKTPQKNIQNYIWRFLSSLS
nr:hypothetical protein [Shigella sp. FC1967]